MKLLSLLSAGLLTLGMVACQHTTGPRFDARAPRVAAGTSTTNLWQTLDSTNRLNPELLQPSHQPLTLGPGDRLEIESLEDLSSRTSVTVGPDGKIYYQLLPGLDVWGLTLAQTKALLEEELGKYTKDRPQVVITLRGVESKRVWMLGRLTTPGIYGMTNSPTLLDAILSAGGLQTFTGNRDMSTISSADEIADLQHSFVIRKGQVLPVDFQRLLRQGDLSQNIYLQADDFVYIPTARPREIYVMGAVAQARPVAYNSDMSLVSAVANAAGPIKDAYLSHVAIVRGSLGQPQVAIVDYKQIVTGNAPDVHLESGDIVYVPFAPYRYITKYLDVIATTFVSSVAINEGSRAVVNQPANTGVLIPLGGRQIITTPAPVVPGGVGTGR